MALSLRRCLARLGLLVEYRSERADNTTCRAKGVISPKDITGARGIVWSGRAVRRSLTSAINHNPLNQPPCWLRCHAGAVVFVHSRWRRLSGEGLSVSLSLCLSVWVWVFILIILVILVCWVTL